MRYSRSPSPSAPPFLHREHVGLELGQLRGADQRLRVDDVRRVALGVAVLARLHVEHELRERAVQAREVAAQEREARAGELRRRREVEQARGLRRGRCGPCGAKSNARGVPQRRTSTLSSDDLPTGALACVRFGRSSRKSRSFACTRSSSPSRRFDLVAEPGDLGQQRRRVLALAFRDADLLRQRVALRLQLLRAHLDVLALALRAPRSARCRASTPRLASAGGHAGQGRRAGD